MADYAFIDFANIEHQIMHSLGLSNEVSTTLSAETILDMMLTRIESRLRTIKFTIEKEFGNYEIILVLDNKSIRKRAIYPGYKLGRDIAPVAIQVADAWARQEKPFKVCESPGNEGDDAICTLVNRNADGRSLIVSADRDLWQLLSDNIQVWCPMKRVQIDELDAYDAFKVSPRHIPLHKACWGDSGDNVPNVLPRQQKQLLPLIRECSGTFESFQALVKARWALLNKRCRELWFENEEQVEINFKLVCLDRHCEIIWH